MDLSIIIVNYNVKYYVEQCIHSIIAATQSLSIEIIVVDNVSSDGSVEYLNKKFGNQIKINANTENVGFGRANNQGVDISKGRYVLFLNPDTFVAEDTFEKCITYLDNNKNVWGLGPKLIDGTGAYLPESKRGFPAIDVAFYKISGLSKIFPKSKTINKYYLGHLSEDENHEVDVLVGCFMLVRRSFLNTEIAFDPDYFMYGEDIDLSYRICKAGYKNVYFSETTVVHYKGESTQKGSLNYVKMFYEAMIIFANKHFSTGKNSYVFFIKLAIIFKGFLTVVKNVLSKFHQFIFDFIAMFMSLSILKFIWTEIVKPEIKFEPHTTLFAFIGYALVWLFCLYLNGAYDKPMKRYRFWRAMLIGTFAVLTIYALLPLGFRFSRGITLLGSVLSILIMFGYRFLFFKLGMTEFAFNAYQKKGILFVGQEFELDKMQKTFKSSQNKLDIKGMISPSNNLSDLALGGIDDIAIVAKKLNIREIIFSYSDQLTYSTIIKLMQKFQNQYEFKIYRKDGETIIGSNSKNTAGDLYSLELNFKILNPDSKRKKRIFDLLVCFVLIFLSPIFVLFYFSKLNLFASWFSVFIGRKTWVGYHSINFDLPISKSFVVDVLFNMNFSNEKLANKMLLDYTMNYNLTLDFNILKNFILEKVSN